MLNSHPYILRLLHVINMYFDSIYELTNIKDFHLYFKFLFNGRVKLEIA